MNTQNTYAKLNHIPNDDFHTPAIIVLLPTWLSITSLPPIEYVGFATASLARTLETKLRHEPAGFPPSDKRVNDYYYYFLYGCRKRASWSWRVYSTSHGAWGGQSDFKCKMTKNTFTIPAQERGGRRALSPEGGWTGLDVVTPHPMCVFLLLYGNIPSVSLIYLVSDISCYGCMYLMTCKQNVAVCNDIKAGSI